MTQYAKKTSASFSMTISIILVISTVIVFTVLLFLSFENMVNHAINNTKNETIRYSNMLAGSMKDFFEDLKVKQEESLEVAESLFD